MVDLGVNRQLRAADFPLHQLGRSRPIATSGVLRDIDDVVSSQGVKLAPVRRRRAGRGQRRHVAGGRPGVQSDGINTRRAEPRNTPTVINAAFNRDANSGTAAHEPIFNGVSPFGVGDQNARVLLAAAESMSLVAIKVRIDNASAGVAGGRSAAQRSRDGIARPHVPRRRQAPRVGAAARAAEGGGRRQRARAVRRPQPTTADESATGASTRPTGS